MVKYFGGVVVANLPKIKGRRVEKWEIALREVMIRV